MQHDHEPTPSGGRTAEAARELKTKVTAKVKEAAGGAQSAAERGKDRVAEKARDVAQALHNASDRLRTDEQSEVAVYTQGIADKIEQLAGTLSGRSLPDLAREVEQFARRQPALFIGGAFSAGLIAARFFKSSAASSGGGGTGARSAFDSPTAGPPTNESYGDDFEASAAVDGFGPVPGGYGPSSPAGAHGGAGTFGSEGTGGGPGNNPGANGTEKAQK
jgi:hypothetical protein